jgi:hypothetical protein
MPPPRVGATPSTFSLDTISSRLEKATTEVAATDVPRPPPAGIDFPLPTVIDKNEAAAASSPLARQAWTASSKVWGDQVEVGGIGDGFTTQLMPKYAVTSQDLQGIKNTALRILASLVPYGTDAIPASALTDLPSKVDAYWAETFQGHPLLPEQRDAMVALIQAAANAD